MAMLMDDHLQGKYLKHLEKLIELSEKEIDRTKWDGAFNKLAHMYHNIFTEFRHIFADQYNRNLVNAFKKFGGNLSVLERAGDIGGIQKSIQSLADLRDALLTFLPEESPLEKIMSGKFDKSVMDALTAMALLVKEEGKYLCAPAVSPFLSADSPRTILPMVLHMAHLWERWSTLTKTVQGSSVPERPVSPSRDAGEQQVHQVAADLARLALLVALEHALGVGREVGLEEVGDVELSEQLDDFALGGCGVAEMSHAGVPDLGDRPPAVDPPVRGGGGPAPLGRRDRRINQSPLTVRHVGWVWLPFHPPLSAQSGLLKHFLGHGSS
jgi:hypothetical protein